MPADTPPSRDREDRRASDSRTDAVEALVLPLLREQAVALAERWSTRARSTLLLDQEDGRETFPAGAAPDLVEMLIADVGGSEGVPERTIGHGIRFGDAAFAHGVSLHHLLKTLDLLVAMTLFAMESTLGRLEDGPVASAADGVRLARRIHRRGALLALATTRGYMHAYSETLRDRFRHLRHDLRTPLGTIKSVLALMDDESVPLEARADPSFRAMATRNVKSLDELIGARLGDVAALLPTTMGQNVSIRAIVCAVRRELRPEAERRGVTVSVQQDGPHGRVDATGLELLLREILEATLQECEPGEQLHIAFDRSVGHAIVAICREEGRSALRHLPVFERLSTLAGQIGATISVGERLQISIRLRPTDVSSTAERLRSVPKNDEDELREGEARHDIRGARESHHGQAGAH